MVKNNNDLKSKSEHKIFSKPRALLVAGSVAVGSLLATQNAERPNISKYTAPVQETTTLKFPENLSIQHWRASAQLSALSDTGNRFVSCSSTRIGPELFVLAKHCFALKHPMDGHLSKPYDAFRSNLPFPPYEIRGGPRVDKIVASSVNSVVYNPQGSDVAIVRVNMNKLDYDMNILPVGTSKDIADLKQGDVLDVVGFPKELESQEFSFSTKYLGSMVAEELPPSETRELGTPEFLLFGVPKSSSQSRADIFCSGGGMSGASFMNDEGKLIGVLSASITPEVPLWQQLDANYGLNDYSAVCLATPITSEMIDSYNLASGVMPSTGPFNYK